MCYVFSRWNFLHIFSTFITYIWPDIIHVSMYICLSYILYAQPIYIYIVYMYMYIYILHIYIQPYTYILCIWLCAYNLYIMMDLCGHKIYVSFINSHFSILNLNMESIHPNLVGFQWGPKFAILKHYRWYCHFYSGGCHLEMMMYIKILTIICNHWIPKITKVVSFIPHKSLHLGNSWNRKNVKIAMEKARCHFKC